MFRTIIFSCLLFSTFSFAQSTSNLSEKNKLIFDNTFFKALNLKSLEDYEGALNAFEKCIDLNSSIASPYYESALIYKRIGYYELAIKNIKKANLLKPKNRWYIYEYAEILFQNKNFKQAVFQYKKLLNQEPKNEKIYFLLAETYIYQSNFIQAINTYEKLEKIKGIDKVLVIQKYKLYMQLKNKKSAIKELLKFLDFQENDIEILQMLAETYLLDNKQPEAVEVLKKIAIINPQNGTLHLTLADYYREQGDNDRSFKELVLAFKSPDLNIDSKVSILASYFSLIQLNEKMKKQAYQLAEIIIQVHKEEYMAYSVYADLLYTDSKFQKAKEYYFLSLEKNKSNQEVWAQILFIQAEQNNYKEILTTSTEALSYFPTNPLFYYFNGISNRSIDNHKECIELLKTGLEFVVDNKLLLIEYYSVLADSYNEIKKHDLSDLFYDKILDIDPDNILALNNYAYYLSLRKEKLEKALEMSLKANMLDENNGTYQDTHAWVLYQSKNYEEAKSWILKSLENEGFKSSVIVEHYGDILYKLGEVKEAVIQWKKALEIGSESKKLKKKIEEQKLYE